MLVSVIACWMCQPANCWLTSSLYQRMWKRFWSQAIIQALTSKCPIDVSSCPKYSTIRETILMMLVFADVVGRGFPLDFSHKRKVAGHAPDLPRPRKTLVWRKKCLQCKHAEVSPKGRFTLFGFVFEGCHSGTHQSAYQSLSRAPPLRPVTQPWRLEWEKNPPGTSLVNHTEPLTQKC